MEENEEGGFLIPFGPSFMRVKFPGRNEVELEVEWKEGEDMIKLNHRYQYGHLVYEGVKRENKVEYEVAYYGDGNVWYETEDGETKYYNRKGELESSFSESG